MKKLGVVVLCSVLSLIVFGLSAHAEIQVNLTSAKFDIVNDTTFRIHYLEITGADGKYWVDFTWDPNFFYFYPINVGAESYNISTFSSGFSYPTGIAINPANRSLYVKSGTTGRVWSTPIQSNGSAGTTKVVTESFTPDMQITFDASGTMYGVEANTKYLYKLGAANDVTKIKLDNSEYYTGAIAIESPGISSSKLFAVSSWYSDYYLRYIPINSIQENSDMVEIGDTCGNIRFMLYRPSVGGIASTYGSSIVNINPTNGSCDVMLSGFVQSAGIAEDETGSIYVADTGAGTITKIYPLGQSEVIVSNLKSPIGLAYDQMTKLLFVAENASGNILAIKIP